MKINAHASRGNGVELAATVDLVYHSGMNHLSKIGLASLLFLFTGLVAGALPRSMTGWSPRSAMTVALVSYGFGLVLALLAFMQSRRGQSLNGTTMFLARAPLALVALGVLVLFLRAMAGW